MNTIGSYAVFAIASAVIMSFIYFLILEKTKTRAENKTGINLINLYLFRKISGFLVLGALPAVAAWIFFEVSPSRAGLTPGGTAGLWPWLAGASIIFITLNMFNSRSPELQAMYPELRLRDWTVKGLTIAIGGWVLYLTGYEYLFRGLLLFSCYDAYGLWPAITINLALYSALHLPKGMKEAIAAIPFGALLCYLTLESRSILPAILIHSLQAVSCELFCIYRNPEMKFTLKRKLS
jgi:membrane protease YdiL (CAAX protease family)